jgi:hypothetical protein
MKQLVNMLAGVAVIAALCCLFGADRILGGIASLVAAHHRTVRSCLAFLQSFYITDGTVVLMPSIKRINCWMRGYHIIDAAGVAKFRFDCDGICHDCGKVGSSIQNEDGE